MGEVICALFLVEGETRSYYKKVSMQYPFVFLIRAE
jgi:hypothetical protein